jgi:hypothetical protein
LISVDPVKEACESCKCENCGKAEDESIFGNEVVAVENNGKK